VGYARRNNYRPDPTDRRATRVHFTEAGWQYLLDAQEVKQAIEAEYRTTLGEDSWRELNAGLTQLLQLDEAM
jgi:DNA-binding MarR family transcriptional regulator